MRRCVAVQEESATWLRADIARHLTNLMPSSAAPSAVGGMVEYLDRLAARAENLCLAVGPDLAGPTRRDGRPIAEAVTDRLFTTSEALDEELDLQRWAEANASPPDPSLDPSGRQGDHRPGSARRGRRP